MSTCIGLGKNIQSKKHSFLKWSSVWQNLTATPIQLETRAKSSSCISDWATGKASGSQGIISNQTKLLGDIISKELKELESFVKEHNPTYNIDLYFWPKIRVENRNRSFQETVLQYERNLVNTIYESIQRAVLRGSYSWWVILPPVMRQGTFLNFEAGRSKGS